MTPDRLLIALLVTIALSLVITVFEATASPSAARCRWCPDFPCWSTSQCGRGCFCIKRGSGLDGECVSIE